MSYHLLCKLLTRVSVILTMALSVFNSSAAELNLQHYQTPSGAIQLFFDGNSIDPYFATKALIVAHALKLDINEPAKKWIAWLLPKQDKNGLFNRYCLKENAWQICATADADDSMAATWIQLLSIVAHEKPMSKEWSSSIELSLKVLSTLKNKKNLYEISTAHRVALLMDNCEVYAALKTYAAYLEKIKQKEDARILYKKANMLNDAIFKEFWKTSIQRYLVSSQTSLEGDKFYPTYVAQLYPMLHGLVPPSTVIPWTFERWSIQYTREWLSFTQDHFPWGYMAVAALQEKSFVWAQTWVLTAKKFRHTNRWNVFEEAIFQGLNNQLFVTGDL